MEAAMIASGKKHPGISRINELQAEKVHLAYQI